MNIEKLDSNFVLNTSITEPDIIWLDAKVPPFSVHGVINDGKRYLRMPESVAKTVSDGVHYLNFDTAGGRIRFRTDSPYIAIHCVSENQPSMPHITLLGQSGFDVYRKCDGEEKSVYIGSLIPPYGVKSGYSSCINTDGKLADYTINMPLYDTVKELYIAVKKTAQLLPCSEEYSNSKPVVFYGSSITQGGCASRPGTCYQAVLSRRLNMDYINLGFSGNAKGEQEIAEYIASLDMSVFVCDYDHNTPDAKHLNNTLYPLYATVRQKHPELPIIFISAPNIAYDYNKYSPRREVIANTYKKIISEGDRNVYYIDGEDLFGSEDWDLCTVDTTHPNDLGFYRMAMRIEKELKPLLG